MTEKPTYEDLVQRIEALEEALLRSESIEKERNHFFELSPDIIGSGHIDGMFTYVNDAFTRTLGYTAGEFCKKPFLDFIHPDDVEKTSRALSDAIAGKRNIYIENRYRCKDGSYKFIDWSVLALKQENRFLAIGRDITGRKQTEEALRESESHLKSLKQSASNFAVYRLAHDDSSPHQLKVVFVSASAREILGIQDPMKLETWFENMHPDDVDRITKANQAAFETMRFDEEYRTYHTDRDEYRWLHAVSTGTQDEAGWTGFVNGILIDITEKHETYQKLKASEKELENRANNLFEMNTALNVLIKKMESKEAECHEQVTGNMQHLVLPYLEKIQSTTQESITKALIDIIESNLNTVTANFSHQLSSSLYGLTSTEIKVANLVRLGNTTKEIAATLHISHKTVESHRERIRKKLGIKNKKINLRSHLLSFI